MSARGYVAVLLLAGVVAVATLVHAVLALRIQSTWIVPDELIYSELAKSLADGGPPRIRDELSYGVVGLGYPAVLAPVWAAFDDTSTAYEAARIVNAFLLALTAVPAFFLARRFVDRSFSLLVAALTVTVPSLLYAGTLMTEVVLYPAFVIAVLAITSAVARPRAPVQIGALAAIGVVCAIKMIGAVLVPSYVVAVVLYDRLERRSGVPRERLARAYAVTWLALGAAAAAVGAALVVEKNRPQDLLGAYSVVLTNLDILGLPWWALLHLAELDLYLAVVPVALTAALATRGLRRHAPPRERLFAAVTVPVVGGVLAVVGAFASTPSPGGDTYPTDVSRLHERSTFILAPLFFVGFAMWVASRSARPLPRTALATAAVLPLVIPVWRLDEHVRFQALALVPWVELRDHVVWPVGVIAFTAALVLWFALATRLRAPVSFVVIPLVAVFVAIGLTAHVSMREASVGARAAMGGSKPDWVDRAVGGEAEVSVLWAEPPGRSFVDLRRRHYVVFVGEFFNESVGRVFELGSPLPYALPTTRAHLRDGRVVVDDGSPARLGRYVLAPCYVHVDGAPVVRDASTGAAVYRVGSPVRATVSRPESCT